MRQSSDIFVKLKKTLNHSIFLKLENYNGFSNFYNANS